jgi:hypothetical protein
MQHCKRQIVKKRPHPACNNQNASQLYLVKTTQEHGTENWPITTSIWAFCYPDRRFDRAGVMAIIFTMSNLPRVINILGAVTLKNALKGVLLSELPLRCTLPRPIGGFQITFLGCVRARVSKGGVFWAVRA